MRLTSLQHYLVFSTFPNQSVATTYMHPTILKHGSRRSKSAVETLPKHLFPQRDTNTGKPMNTKARGRREQ